MTFRWPWTCLSCNCHLKFYVWRQSSNKNPDDLETTLNLFVCTIAITYSKFEANPGKLPRWPWTWPWMTPFSISVSYPPCPWDYFPQVSAQSEQYPDDLEPDLEGHPPWYHFHTRPALRITFPKSQPNRSNLKFDLTLTLGDTPSLISFSYPHCP